MFVSRIRVAFSGQDVAWLLGSPSMLPSRLGWRIPCAYGLVDRRDSSQPASQPPFQLVLPLTPMPSGSQSCRTAPRRHHTTPHNLLHAVYACSPPPPFSPSRHPHTPHTSPSHLSSFYCPQLQRLGCAGKMFLAAAQCPIASLRGEQCGAQHNTHKHQLATV